MSENKGYVALGEETDRNTGEVTTVGFVPTEDLTIPEMEFTDEPRAEWRGEESRKGVTTTLRRGQKWATEFVMPMFSEAGTTVGMVGTLFKHYFGYTSSAQNATTGQWKHMLSPHADPLSQLGTKALTYSLNRNRGTVMTNYPFVGGRVNKLGFSQESGQPLKATVGMVGTFKDTNTAELGSEVFADEDRRFDYNNLTAYFGTITKVGSAPNFTDITFGSATQFCPTKVDVTFENGLEDNMELCGTDYPNKTTWGNFSGTLSIEIDLLTSGLNSEGEYDNFFTSPETQNKAFALVWDSGTEAGTSGGDNHSMILDLPQCILTSAVPEYNLETDPVITLEYSFEYNSTTTYAYGLLLKNDATAI